MFKYLIRKILTRRIIFLVNNKSNRLQKVQNFLQNIFGYKIVDYISNRKKIAIHAQLIEHDLLCKQKACTINLKSESCSPFETIYCETCKKNICSLTVDYYTKLPKN